MDVEIKKLKEPYNYAEIANVLRETYFKEYCNAGALQWSEEYAKFYFDAIALKEFSREFIYGAYIGEKLVGTIFGHQDLMRFENRLTLNTINLGLTAVKPEYKRQGIASELVAKVVEQAKKKKIDVLMAFPEKARYGDKLLDKFDFKNYGKTKHLIKLMEDQGLTMLRDNMGVNVVVRKLATLFSHIDWDMNDPEGTIRYGKYEESKEVCGILNSYTTRVPLVSLYTPDGYKISNIRFAKMNERFGDPWSFHWLVLERNGKIIATLSYRIEVVTFENKDGQFISGPVALLTSLGYHEAMDLEEKVQFVNGVLKMIRSKYPKAYITQITCPQHEMKPFSKLRFVSDRAGYYLYMLPLTEQAEALNTHKKYKEYLLQYFR